MLTEHLLDQNRELVGVVGDKAEEIAGDFGRKKDRKAEQIWKESSFLAVAAGPDKDKAVAAVAVELAGDSSAGTEDDSPALKVSVKVKNCCRLLANFAEFSRNCSKESPFGGSL